MAPYIRFRGGKLTLDARSVVQRVGLARDDLRIDFDGEVSRRDVPVADII